MMIDRYRPQVRVIELGVRQSNEGASNEGASNVGARRLGFVDMTFSEDVGYFIMQKRLDSQASNRALDEGMKGQP